MQLERSQDGAVLLDVASKRSTAVAGLRPSTSVGPSTPEGARKLDELAASSVLPGIRPSASSHWGVAMHVGTEATSP